MRHGGRRSGTAPRRSRSRPGSRVQGPGSILGYGAHGTAATPRVGQDRLPRPGLRFLANGGVQRLDRLGEVDQGLEHLVVGRPGHHTAIVAASWSAPVSSARTPKLAGRISIAAAVAGWVCRWIEVATPSRSGVPVAPSSPPMRSASGLRRLQSQPGGLRPGWWIPCR